MSTHARAKTGFIDPVVTEHMPAISDQHAHDFSPEMRPNTDIPRFLVTMFKGIGDAVMGGLTEAILS